MNNYLTELPEELISIIITYLKYNSVETVIRSIDLPDSLFKKLVYQQYKFLGITYLPSYETWKKLYLSLSFVYSMYSLDTLHEDLIKYLEGDVFKNNGKNIQIDNIQFLIKTIKINDFYNKYTFLFNKIPNMYKFHKYTGMVKYLDHPPPTIYFYARGNREYYVEEDPLNLGKYDYNYNVEFNLLNYFKTGNPEFVLNYIPKLNKMLFKICLKYVAVDPYVTLDWILYFFYVSELKFLSKIIKALDIDFLIYLLQL
jgi:septum formation topological specificity factor MinE